jgi:hypothetical protein
VEKVSGSGKKSLSCWAGRGPGIGSAVEKKLDLGVLDRHALDRISMCWIGKRSIRMRWTADVVDWGCGRLEIGRLSHDQYVQDRNMGGGP